MALLNNPALNNGMTGSSSEKKTDNIYTANAMLNKPQKVSNRTVEAVPRPTVQTPGLDPVSATNNVDFAKSQATLGSVGENATVQGQLGKILASNSPLLSRARADSNAAYAERGLNNSSIGVQAGEEAVIRTALPIAQQDAQTHANQDLENQRSTNQFGELGLNQEYTSLNQKNQNDFTAQESALDRDYKTAERIGAQDYNTSERVATQDFNNAERLDTQNYNTSERTAGQDFQSQENQAQADRNLASSKELSEQAYNQQRALQELDAAQKVAMNDIQNLYAREINASQMGAQLFQNHQNAVAQVMGNSSLSASQAQATITVLNQSLKDALKLAGALNGIDMAKYANTVTVTDAPVDGSGSNLNVIPDTPEALAVAEEKKKEAAKYEAWLDELIAVPNTKMGKNQPSTVYMSRREAIEKGWDVKPYKP
ncbi:MAG TPA: hypothetical protein VN030_11545 [Cellvibrio sp.]|nr:hypothetical protein [Cellvibrio sp.]